MQVQTHQAGTSPADAQPPFCAAIYCRCDMEVEPAEGGWLRIALPIIVIGVLQIMHIARENHAVLPTHFASASKLFVLKPYFASCLSPKSALS